MSDPTVALNFVSSPLIPGPSFEPGDRIVMPDGTTRVVGSVTYSSPAPVPLPEPDGLVGADELQVGVTYRVEFDDCCAKGSFTSELAEIGYDERYPDYPVKLRWTNGVELAEWGQAEFWETDGTVDR